jgi:ketosteroid isomerase-like protein
MDAKSERVGLLRRYFDALESFASVDEIGAFLHPEAKLVELPHGFAPDGVTRDRATFLATTQKAPTLFSSQRYVVRSAILEGSNAAVEVEWRASLSQAARSDERARGASTLRAVFAIFFEFRDGQIIAQRNYNCFLRG